MNTYEERFAQYQAMLNDEVLNLTFTEWAALTYHHLMHEVHNIRSDKAERRARKHRKWLANFAHIANARHELSKL